ncbi:MAG: hypothetical protein ACE364_10065 [Chlorobiota bacterium]
MRLLITAILVLSLTGCELFVIGKSTPQKEVIDITQQTSTGGALLFATELKRGNVRGAAQLIADNTTRISADKQSEIYYDLARYTRILNKREVSRIITDTLAKDLHNIRIEYDYLREFSFAMRELDSLWYVIEYKQLN